MYWNILEYIELGLDFMNIYVTICVFYVWAPCMGPWDPWPNICVWAPCMGPWDPWPYKKCFFEKCVGDLLFEKQNT